MIAISQAIATCGLLQFTPAARAQQPPRVFLLDAKVLVETKRRVTAGDATIAPALGRLRSEADAALNIGPFSVVDNQIVPPSGDKHDYMSIGPYWWPNPDTPDGKPYVRRDGEVNPERNGHDRIPLGRMCDAVDTLALAHYLTGREEYAGRAATLLRVWFLDETTRMNPHLQYGQGIPGRCEGRGIGIIDTACLARLIDSVGMLAGSKAWSPDDQEALQAWFREYLKWVLESEYGRYEARTKNNHGTWYDVQVASYALFVGRRDLAKRVLSEAARRRIARHVEPDGRQPHELARTKSFSYSTMNLRGLCHLAVLGDRVGVDLWGFQTDDGRDIRRALDFLVPYAVGEKPWPYKQITGFHPAGLAPMMRLAAKAYGEPRYGQLTERLRGFDPADRVNLLYPKL
jgi:hypothetical protein